MHRVRYMPAIGYVERIRACAGANLADFVPWHVGSAVVGHVHRAHLVHLRADDALREAADGRWTLAGEDFASRSANLARVVGRLCGEGLLRPPLGEMYAVLAGCSPEPLLQVDRTAVAWFGVRGFGIHLNGWVRRRDGLHLWIAERARQKRSYAGHLDNLVAGGQAIGLTARETMQKECAEEAGIPASLAARAVPVGTIAYVQEVDRTLKPDTLFCFDLELPEGFQPRPVDGEVEGFQLLPVCEVAASLRGNGLWKPNSALVALHFLLRRGALDGELAATERWGLWQALHVAG